METVQWNRKWDNILFRDVSAYLIGLGFQRYEVLEKPGPCWAFEKEEEDAFIILPHFTDRQAPRPHHIIGIRKLLDERGMAASADFDAAFDRMSQANSELTEKVLVEAA